VKRALVAAALILAGCGSSSSSPTSAASSTAVSTSSTPAPAHLAAGFHMTSPAFRAGHAIPRAYTCDGPDTQLPLHWTGVPAGAKELVLVMRDPDAPGGPFVHWALAGIPPSATGVPAGGVIPGRNSFGSLSYRGPCPPPGDKPHHYVLTLNALATPSGLHAGFNPDELRSRTLAIATLIGTYARAR
jgi:Raf kinase inhibitor-like YbhB/YbcL family protein